MHQGYDRSVKTFSLSPVCLVYQCSLKRNEFSHLAPPFVLQFYHSFFILVHSYG